MFGAAEGQEPVTPGQEKMNAKQEREEKIARLSESVATKKKERESFLEQIEQLRTQIAQDEQGDARVNEARIAALKEYEAILEETVTELQEDEERLKIEEAQYRTIFGPPLEARL